MMGRRKVKSDLGLFHKAAVESGLTYAAAQIQETCGIVGKVRAPKGDNPDDTPYRKVSTWNMQRELHFDGGGECLKKMF